MMGTLPKPSQYNWVNVQKRDDNEKLLSAVLIYALSSGAMMMNCDDLFVVP